MMCRHRNFAVSYNPIGFVSKIKELVKEADAEERFHLLGYCADAAVLMRDLDCFVMTSHWEGLPTTLLESMNAGTPIAFMKGEGSLVDLWDLNRQGIPFAITSKKGDVQDLASHICSLLTNHEMAERQIRRSREVLRECFSVDSVAAQLTDIYQSLVLEKVS